MGSKRLPDYREYALVGAEQNSTNSAITNHDIYTKGQSKEDKFPSHTHSFTGTYHEASGFDTSSSFPNTNRNVTINHLSGSESAIGTWSNNYWVKFNWTDGGTIGYTGDGVITRGKRKAVYWYIKY